MHLKWEIHLPRHEDGLHNSLYRVFPEIRSNFWSIYGQFLINSIPGPIWLWPYHFIWSLFGFKYRHKIDFAIFFCCTVLLLWSLSFSEKWTTYLGLFYKSIHLEALLKKDWFLVPLCSVGTHLNRSKIQGVQPFLYYSLTRFGEKAGFGF